MSAFMEQKRRELEAAGIDPERLAPGQYRLAYRKCQARGAVHQVLAQHQHCVVGFHLPHGGNRQAAGAL